MSTHRKKRIAIIITMLELGGAQQIALYLAEHLDRTRYEVYLITHDKGLLVEAAQKIPNLTIKFMPSLRREIRPWQDAQACIQMWRFLRQEQIDIVHTHSSKAGIVGRIAAWLARVPVRLHTIHGYAFHDYQSPFVRTVYVWVERLTARISTRLIPVADANIEKGLAANIGHPGLYHTIHCGIRIAEFADVDVDPVMLKNELGLSPEAKVVGQIGNFKPQKNPLDFVRVAVRVLESGADCEFVLIGDGPLRPEVEALIARSGFQDRIKVLGWRNDIPELIQILDIVVLTSLWEGLPLVFMQAMAAGKPVVANHVDGGAEAIYDGENGYLLPPGEVANMAARITELLHDDQLRHKMGQRGRELAGEFDIDLMVRRHDALYAELLP